jgi:hypothetical protein
MQGARDAALPAVLAALAVVCWSADSSRASR